MCIRDRYWTLRAATRVLFTTETERELAQHTFWPARWTPLVTPLGCEPPPEDTASLIAAFHARCPELDVYKRQAHSPSLPI